MPPIAPRHPPTKRNAVAELMRETDLTVEAIAAKIGVPYTTVCGWNQRYNWRPWLKRRPQTVDPQRWSPARLAALERVYRQAGVDHGDLAQAVGTDRERARSFFRECGFPERVAPPPEDALEGGGLRRLLRTHLARQIADLDAELSLRRKSPAEATQMLRDLAALKKMVEEVEPVRAAAVAEPEESEESLDERRAAIWNRYVTFARNQLGEDASEEAIEAAANADFIGRLAQCAPIARRLHAAQSS